MAPATLIYDGDCGLCTWSVDWLVAHWPTPPPCTPVASQRFSDDALDGFSLHRADVDRAAWWIDEGGAVGGHLAVARSLAACEGVAGVLGRWMERRPLRWLAAFLYSLTVRNRHRVSVGPTRCGATRP